jgi:cyclopropane fatty-acyl-phospholipid synthase-like methyltransferase
MSRVPELQPATNPPLRPEPRLLSLPAPRHIQEFLTRSGHLHFGYFETPLDSLAQAQERLIQRGARLLPRSSLVADVGCGLGGTVQLLANLGHRVYGLDPCAASISYARTRVNSSRAQLLACDLAEFAQRAKGARFDAVVLTEVLANFRDLGALFGHCRSVLRPGGLVLAHEVAWQTAAGAPIRGVRYHAREALRTAADSAGFDVLESRELGHRTSPTLTRTMRALQERRAELLTAFRESHPQIEGEIAALLEDLRALELAFAKGELVYESLLLRCSARMSTDSVVMRVPAALAPRPGAAAKSPSEG